MQGRIRTGRPLPSQPLREHRGSRTRARYREKNAPLRRREKSFSSHFVQSFYFGFEEIVEKFCQEVPHLRCNQTQSDAIRRNQTHSDAISMPGALCFRVFVFWAGRKGLCFVFLCFGLAQRACVLCFRVLADPPQNTARGQLIRWTLATGPREHLAPPCPEA
jgi:hypothetical protein